MGTWMILSVLAGFFGLILIFRGGMGYGIGRVMGHGFAALTGNDAHRREDTLDRFHKGEFLVGLVLLVAGLVGVLVNLAF